MIKVQITVIDESVQEPQQELLEKRELSSQELVDLLQAFKVEKWLRESRVIMGARGRWRDEIVLAGGRSIVLEELE